STGCAGLIVRHPSTRSPDTSQWASSTTRQTLAAFDRRLARKEPIEPRDHVGQVRAIAGGNLGRDVTVVADFVQGPAHVEPVDGAVAEVLPAVGALLDLEILHVYAADARAERADPVLREPVEHDVADVEIGLE